MRERPPLQFDWNERESFVFYGSFEMFRPADSTPGQGPPRQGDCRARAHYTRRPDGTNGRMGPGHEAPTLQGNDIHVAVGGQVHAAPR